jgi:hypothetical protein
MGYFSFKNLLSMKFKPLIIIVLALLSFSVGFSQQADPFKPGEKLTFSGKFSKSLIRGIDVGDIVFTFSKSADNKTYSTKAEATSKGSLLKLFRFSFYQNIESTIDTENFYALKTTKRDQQKERVRDSEAVFDYSSNKVTYTETDPNDRLKAPRKIASVFDGEAHDIISGIYELRRLPLAVGKVFQLTVSDSGLVYKVPVRVISKERQTTILGKVMCFRIEPEVFGPNRFIEQKGSMIIWITDDEKRLPVRSQINASLGRIEVKLKKIE